MPNGNFFKNFVPLLGIMGEEIIEINEFKLCSYLDNRIVGFSSKIFDDLFREHKLDKRYIFTITWETLYWEFRATEMIEAVYEIIEKNEIPNTHWAIIVSNENKPYLDDKEYPGVYFVEFFALLTYYFTEIKENNWSDKWNPEAQRGLFLTGKPHKENRIGLLAEFYRAGLLDRLEWSLFMSKGMKEDCQKITNFCEEEYEIFLKECIRTPDNVRVDWQKKSLHYGGFPYDTELYSQTKISIISETRWDDDIRITEKTWRTIANNHPFIMAGSPGTLKRLQDMGFYTFEKYLPFPRYNDILREWNLNGVYYKTYRQRDRLKEIIQNTEGFLNQKFDSPLREKIEKEIAWNRNRYLEIVKEDHETIFQILDQRFDLITPP